MSINAYASGSLVRMSAAFAVGSVATDPTTVTGSIRLPDGTEPALSPTKDSVGNWHADYSVTLAGEYFYRLVGSGACQAAAEGQFQVLPNPF